jgi:hypothetical protein
MQIKPQPFFDMLAYSTTDAKDQNQYLSKQKDMKNWKELWCFQFCLMGWNWQHLLWKERIFQSKNFLMKYLNLNMKGLTTEEHMVKWLKEF